MTEHSFSFVGPGITTGCPSTRTDPFRRGLMRYPMVGTYGTRQKKCILTYKLSLRQPKYWISTRTFFIVEINDEPTLKRF
jgi:hypothetical protein